MRTKLTSRCGRRGCWDTIATLSWLRREAARIGPPAAEAINSARLMAGRDRPGAAELLDRYARNVAVGIANLQQTIAPKAMPKLDRGWRNYVLPSPHALFLRSPRTQ
jgi:predicted NBD/HSP70 family sugar kinase